MHFRMQWRRRCWTDIVMMLIHGKAFIRDARFIQQTVDVLNKKTLKVTLNLFRKAASGSKWSSHASWRSQGCSRSFWSKSILQPWPSTVPLEWKLIIFFPELNIFFFNLKIPFSAKPESTWSNAVAVVVESFKVDAKFNGKEISFSVHLHSRAHSHLHSWLRWNIVLFIFQIKILYLFRNRRRRRFSLAPPFKAAHSTNQRGKILAKSLNCVPLWGAKALPK